jgi:hypothetical protein
LKPLAPSPAWTLVTPYCKRTRPGRGTNTKAAGFPPLSRRSPATSLPPFALGLASTHLGWGTRRHSLVGLGTPRSRNVDTLDNKCSQKTTYIESREEDGLFAKKPLRDHSRDHSRDHILNELIVHALRACIMERHQNGSPIIIDN